MPDPTDDARRIFAIFNEIGIVGQLSRAMFEARLPEGVLVNHFSLVNHLIRVKDGQTPLALARAFQVPKTTMSHTVAVAVKHGWVELRPNPRDGRSKTVWVTDTGRQFRDDAIAALGPDLAFVAEHVPDDAQAQLLAHLTEMRKLLDAYRDPENGSSG